MENIHHISEAHPNLLVGKIGMNGDGCRPSGMDDSPLRDLDDSDEKRRIEIRQVRLQFEKLNTFQQARLKDFIIDHRTGEEHEWRMTDDE